MGYVNIKLVFLNKLKYLNINFIDIHFNNKITNNKMFRKNKNNMFTQYFQQQ